MNFITFSKIIVITFVMLAQTLIIIKPTPLVNHLMSISCLPELIYSVIIAHNLTHISTTFLDSAIVVTGRLNIIFFSVLFDVFS